MQRPVQLAALLLLTGCPKAGPQTPESALAPLADARGRIVGHVRVDPSASGVDVDVRVYALPRSSRWQVVLHAGTDCGGHSFSSAGPAWSPPGAPGPARFGPLLSDDRGRAVLHASDPALTLAGVANGVLGKAVLLEPDGAEGGPRACGVFGPPPSQEVHVGGAQPDVTDAWEL